MTTHLIFWFADYFFLFLLVRLYFCSLCFLQTIFLVSSLSSSSFSKSSYLSSLRDPRLRVRILAEHRFCFDWTIMHIWVKRNWKPVKTTSSVVGKIADFPIPYKISS